jgi:hypothetical protein
MDAISVGIIRYMNNKIKCLMRYIELNGFAELSEYLISIKLADAVEAKSKTRTQEQAEYIYFALKAGEKSEALMLLDFEWSILPLEQIKITIVSAREEKHFTHGY